MILIWFISAVLFVCFALIVLVGAPYVPTKQAEIGKIFAELKIKRGEKVIDLGSGDGRVVMAAAKKGLWATGYELNPLLVIISKLRVRKLKNAEIKLADYWSADLSDYKLVFIFSAQPYMNRLVKKLNAELKRGSLVVSYGFSLPGRKIKKRLGAAYLYRF